MTVTPLDAATVILMRNCIDKNTSGFEVLMVRRNSKSVFVPNAYVFPGGKVEQNDCLSEIKKYCNENDLINSMSMLDAVSSQQIALGILIAAIRETFEEAGLLLVRQNNGALLDYNNSDIEQKLYLYRDDLKTSVLKFTDILKKENFTLAINHLHYFSHWITPELSPLRYDTRFFVCEVPEKQKALHDGDEVTKHVWITPKAALQKYREQKFYMVAPTVVTLEELSCFETIEQVIKSTTNKNIKSAITHLTFEKDDVQERTADGRIFRNFTPSD